MDQKWGLSGTYFEVCNCDTICPCVFGGPPTQEDCTALAAWHIDQGIYGDVNLDGLNTVLSLYVAEHMGNPWKVALYLDENANAEQQDALTQIFTGQVGSVPAVLREFIGEIMGVTTAAIQYQANGKTCSLRIDGIASVTTERMEGLAGSAVTLSNLGGSIAPGYPLIIAKSKSVTYDDYGYQWEFSHKTSFYAPFTYEGG